MEFKTEDLNKVVAIEAGIKDFKLLRDLLKYEVALQLSIQIAKTDSDHNNKVKSIIELFTTFRSIEDQLFDFEDSMSLNNNSLQKLGNDIKTIIVTNKNVCKLYKMLLTETIKDGVPKDLVKKYQDYSADLLKRIDKALLKEYSRDELDLRSIKKESSEVKEDNKLGINILGIKGLA